jgi:hypothetical protein
MDATKMRLTLKTLAMLLAALLPGAAWAAAFTASLDRDTLTLGESATLSLTFEGGQPGNITMPQVSDLQINQVGQTSHTTSDFSGHGTTVTTVLLAVAPQKTGEFVIPALTADINGQPFSSPPIKLTVTAASAPSADAISSGNEIAFLKLSFPKQKVYAGESVVARLELYLRDDVQNFGNFQLTDSPTDGFSAGKPVELPNQRRRVRVGSRVYTIIPYAVPLTAVKTGAFTLGPFTANVIVVMPNGWFGEQKPVSLVTESAQVESRQLPAENKPTNFTGAIGNFTIAATAGPTAVSVGDPITVRVQISGRGALDAVTLPEQGWQNFKTYPPTTKLETTDQFGFQGTKTFEQIISPLNNDVHELPALTFSFFNPEDGRYHTLTQPAVPLTVKVAGATPLPPMAANKNANEEKPAQDILPIKEKLGVLSPAKTPLVTQPVFLATQSVPVLAFLGAFVWRKRTDNLANNPRLRRRLQVKKLLQTGMSDLKRFAVENNSEAFFATLFRLLQEQLGERLDCPASAITEDVVDGHALLRNAPATLRTSLHEQFQLCNQVRYAPVRGSSELNSVAAQFEKLIGELQNLKS